MSENWLLCSEGELGDEHDKTYGAPIAIIQIADYDALLKVVYADINRDEDSTPKLLTGYPAGIFGTPLQLDVFGITTALETGITRIAWQTHTGRKVIYVMRLPQVWGWTPIAHAPIASE
jgi:hypothetical protein